MNKTVNINLAGILFQIDEDAYRKLHDYLQNVRKSISDPQGREEIMQDIEARIAELFQEKMTTKSQIVSLNMVESVTDLMGRPEDYIVDDEIFEDEPTTKKKEQATAKKLYRDTRHGNVAGVSTGLAHYIGIDPIWMHLAWILLCFLSFGIFIVAYIIFWVLVPEAKSTSDYLHMQGKAVNIDNIEKKVKEGFDSVSQKMKDVDYQKYGEKAKHGTVTIFENLGNLIANCFKLLIKIIGIFLMVVSGMFLISIIFTFFGIGIFGFTGADWINYFELYYTSSSILVASLCLLFAMGIPLIFLFILGLKILIPNLKSVGNTVKYVLLSLWLIAVFLLIYFGVRQATYHMFENQVYAVETLPVQKNDTLFVKMRRSNIYSESIHWNNEFQIKINKNGEKVLFSKNIRITYIPSKDSIAKIEIEKSADGNSFINATKNAEKIQYSYIFKGNTLYLDSFFTTDILDGFQDQEVAIRLYLPLESIIYAGKNTENFNRYNSYILDEETEHFLRVEKNSPTCLDCPISKVKHQSIIRYSSTENGEENIKVKISADGVKVYRQTDSLNN